MKKMLYVIGLFSTIVLKSTYANPPPVTHSHEGRTHRHVLPNNGIENHNHNKQKKKEISDGTKEIKSLKVVASTNTAKLQSLYNEVKTIFMSDTGNPSFSHNTSLDIIREKTSDYIKKRDIKRKKLYDKINKFIIDGAIFSYKDLSAKYVRGVIKKVPYVDGKKHGVETWEGRNNYGYTPWVNGKKHGVVYWYGRSHSTNSITPFINGKKHGVEISDSYKGREFTSWKNGKRHGENLMLFSDGDKIMKIWNNGEKEKEIRDVSPNMLSIQSAHGMRGFTSGVLGILDAGVKSGIIDLSGGDKKNHSSNKNTSCNDFSTLNINIENQLEIKPRFNVTPPEGTSFKGGGGFIFSNNKSDSGTVTNHFDGCIAGNYSFTYSYQNSGKMHNYSGSFYLDGKHSSYDINISQSGLFSGPTIRINGW